MGGDALIDLVETVQGTISGAEEYSSRWSCVSVSARVDSSATGIMPTSEDRIAG